MATTQTIDATIFASSHPDIAKRTSISGVLFSSFMLLVGILAFASTFELEDRSSTVSGVRDGTIPCRYFPSFLEVKGSCLSTDRKYCKGTQCLL